MTLSVKPRRKLSGKFSKLLEFLKQGGLIHYEELDNGLFRVRGSNCLRGLADGLGCIAMTYWALKTVHRELFVTYHGERAVLCRPYWRSAFPRGPRDVASLEELLNLYPSSHEGDCSKCPLAHALSYNSLVIGSGLYEKVAAVLGHERGCGMCRKSVLNMLASELPSSLGALGLEVLASARVPHVEGQVSDLVSNLLDMERTTDGAGVSAFLALSVAARLRETPVVLGIDVELCSGGRVVIAPDVLVSEDVNLGASSVLAIELTCGKNSGPYEDHHKRKAGSAILARDYIPSLMMLYIGVSGHKPQLMPHGSSAYLFLPFDAFQGRADRIYSAVADSASLALAGDEDWRAPLKQALRELTR